MIKKSIYEQVKTKNPKTRHELAKRACYGKIQHKSLLSAEHVFNNMKGRDSHLLEIYKCPFCKFYHIGHNTTKNKKSK